ncbi:MAG: apolipoprotein N-acyltransferase [Pseudomonadota bacterium]
MRQTVAKCLLALVFGAAMTMSFAPADAWWFTPYCLAGLFMLAAGCGARLGFALGLSFGLGWFGLGLWWTAGAMARFTQAGTGLSVTLTGALCVYLSLFPAIVMALYGWLVRTGPAQLRAAPGVFVLAALWTLGEWSRANLLGGMPLLATGYAHASGPLGGFAPAIGVLGLGFLNAVVAAALAQCLTELGKAGGWRRWRYFPLALLALCLAGSGLDRIDWTHATGQTLRLSLLQGNLSQQEKFTPQGFRRAVETYAALIRSSSADLTVLPETALPIEWYSSPPELIAAWRGLAAERRTSLVIGAVAAAPSRPGLVGDSTNSALVMLPDSAQPGYDYRYDKIHLLPLAEYAPPGAGWIAQRVQPELGTLLAGDPDQPPLHLAQGAVALGICYESMFDTLIARKARTANLILNISNFAWFTGSYADAQHLQAGRMRARETGRWFVQSANTGITAIVDPHGVVRQVLPADVTGVLEGAVTMQDGSTPFMLMGNAPLLAACLVFLGTMLRSRPVPMDIVAGISALRRTCRENAAFLPGRLQEGGSCQAEDLSLNVA